MLVKTGSVWTIKIWTIKVFHNEWMVVYSRLTGSFALTGSQPKS